MFFLCFIQSLLIQRFNIWSQVYVVKLLTLPQHGVILGFERFSCLLDSLSAGGFEIRWEGVVTLCCLWGCEVIHVEQYLLFFFSFIYVENIEGTWVQMLISWQGYSFHFLLCFDLLVIRGTMIFHHPALWCHRMKALLVWKVLSFSTAWRTFYNLCVYLNFF